MDTFKCVNDTYFSDRKTEFLHGIKNHLYSTFTVAKFQIIRQQEVNIIDSC